MVRIIGASAMDEIFEVLLEIAWKGPGYLILRFLRPNSQTNPGECLVLVVGTAFWAVVALAVWGFVLLLSR